jgi:site-specific DNA recombinase
MATTNNSKKLKAAGYIRVSSKDQVDGYSLDYQTESIQNYCKDKYDLVEIYSEQGISGKTVSERDAFQDMYRDALSGKFEVIVIWKLDRFTRDIESGVASFYGLKKKGIQIFSIQEGQVSENDIITLMSICMADKFSKDLIVNVKRGMKAKLKSGDPRIGLAGEPIARYWDEENKIFRLKEDEAAEWRTVAKQYITGISVDEIGKQSKERGSKTIPTSGVNIRKKLKRGLGNKHIIHCDGEVFEFASEPIVDEKIEKAVLKLIEKRTFAPHVKPDKYLLSGYIRCADCSKKLNSHIKTKDGLTYYIHTNRNGCNAIKSIRVDYIDEAVLKECFVVLGGDKKAFDEAVKQHLPDADARREIEKEINSLKRQLSKYDRDKEIILDKVLTQNLNCSIIDGLNKRAEQIDKSVEQAKRDLYKKEQSLNSMMSVEEYQAMAEKIYDYWQRVYTGWGAMEDMDWKNRRYLIDLMFDGTDEDGRAYGVYVKKIKGKVFEYEIYGRFSVGSRFLKNDDFDYYGAETEPIQAEWRKQLEAEREAYFKSKNSSCLEMGGTGLEPVTSCV